MQLSTSLEEIRLMILLNVTALELRPGIVKADEGHGRTEAATKNLRA